MYCFHPFWIPMCCVFGNDLDLIITQRSFYFNQDGGSTTNTTGWHTWYVGACDINKAAGKHVRHCNIKSLSMFIHLFILFGFHAAPSIYISWLQFIMLIFMNLEGMAKWSSMSKCNTLISPFEMGDVTKI